MTDPISPQQFSAAHVRVERNLPDDHLGWCTLRKLGYSAEPPGTPKATVLALLDILRHQEAAVTIYATPLSKVTAPTLSAAFINVARTEQRAWWSHLKDRLHSTTRVKRHYVKANPLIRQLEFTGVMIVEGKHVFPNCWPEPVISPSPHQLAGRTFGRLVVLEDLPRGLCRCRCQCPAGNETTVKRKHLLGDRTKSCGCLRAEFEKRIEHQRAKRSRS